MPGEEAKAVLYFRQAGEPATGGVLRKMEGADGTKSEIPFREQP